MPEQADAVARRGRKDYKPHGYRGHRRVWVGANGGPKSGHSWLKHMTRKWMRRWAKRDPENAPRKNRYRGWET